MKLENQVVSLELAKKLKELGVKQDSIFYWVKGGSTKEECPDCKKAGGIIPECFYCAGTGKGEVKQNYYLYSEQECSKDIRSKDYSAYTVAELGEMLPPYTKSHYTASGKHFCYVPDDFKVLGQVAKTEADARAKMLIYLIENKLTNKE